MKKTALLFLLFIVVLALPLQAEPMYITLEELRDAAPNIVLATFKGGANGVKDIWSTMAFDIEVLQVFKGGLKPGRLTVPIGSGHPTVGEGETVIAFLEEDHGWSWYAKPMGLATDPKDDLWEIDGFYDFNAYLVHPSQLTLPMMRSFFLEYKPYSRHYAGPLCFFDPKLPGLRASKHHIELDCPTQSAPQLLSSLPLNDFAKSALDMRLTCGFGSDIEVQLQSTVTGRRVELHGNVREVDPETGGFTCQFWVPDPAMYTEEMLLTFLADPQIYHPTYELRLAVEGKGEWTMWLDEEYGHIGSITGTPWGRLDFSEISDHPITFVTGWAGQERLEIRTDKGRDDGLGLDYTSTDGAIIQNLMIAPMQCMIHRGAAGKTVPFGKGSIRLHKVHYDKRY